jgi:FkbM family methyltransferase
MTVNASSLPWGACAPELPARAIIALSRHTPLGRGAARGKLADALMRLHPGPVDSWLWETKVRLHPARNVSERKALLRPGRMDPQEYARLNRSMSETGAVFVDVGANAGLYSLYAALKARPKGRILAIEPDAALLDRLCFNLALANEGGRIDSTVRIDMASVAVGDAEGEAFLSADGSEGSRSLLTGTGRPVRVRPLLAVLDEHGIDVVSLMKIDIEGYEDRVLPPYLSVAPRHRWPLAIIAEHAHADRWSVDCIGFCRDRGYRVEQKTSNNTILELPP